MAFYSNTRWSVKRVNLTTLYSQFVGEKAPHYFIGRVFLRRNPVKAEIYMSSPWQASSKAGG